jgi:FAD/FMN-containing dehydrogenase
MRAPLRGLAPLLAAALAAAAPAAAEPVTVDDVSRLNPIAVERVASPRSVEEVVALVREHRGPLSIGGARHSMGGQIATEGALFLDMRGLDRIVAFSPAERTITVEAGATWRAIQEAIDPHGLAVSIMQSYANFTVGGSLSVNAHGRYVGRGPLIESVRGIRLVLADGSLVEASRDVRPELFHGAIGGYGGLGVIVEATLELAENRRLARSVRTLPVAAYRAWFLDEVRDDPRAVFHNGDLYPPEYDTVRAITWSETERPATVPERLVPIGGSHAFDRVAIFGVSELPFGKELRAKVLDPLRLRDEPVVWRNYEASYDVEELEPRSRALTTYVLQEYFVPIAGFERFVPRMAAIFRAHDVNVMNVSIRHAKRDPGSLLAWAREECFAFVVYYKQGTSRKAREAVGVWTRELIDAALEAGGTYYLPYQIHATDEQFHRAYPRAEEFFAQKRAVDPEYRLRNRLWDRYYDADDGAEAVRAALAAHPGYRRSEDQTYLTLPEWMIVFSADEQAAFLRAGRPSGFPWFRSIGQFWGAYRAVLDETSGRYPFHWGYNTMIGVIGASYTAEYALKGLYEATLGRAAEWASGGAPGALDTAADRFVAEGAADYGAFLHHTPWYDYPFGARLEALWAADFGGDGVRGAERRLAGSAELIAKAGWGWAIGRATAAGYEEPILETVAWTRPFPDALLPPDAGVRVLDSPSPGARLLAIPRYEPFTGAVVALAGAGVRFVEIAGNDEILLTVVAPRAWQDAGGRGRVVHEWPFLTRPEEKRVALSLPVARLHEVIPSLEREGLRIDHVFDY